jgi:hypothetical protein
MAETRTIQNSFNTGEVSPMIGGRTDQQRYFNSCRTLENFVPLIQGGVRRRGGMAYAGAAKAVAYLIPFIFSRTDVYVLEFTDKIIRFWKYDAYGNPSQIPDSITPLEVVTTYTLAELPSVVVKQSADVLFIVHPAHAPAKLSRITETSWTLSDIIFDPPPTYEPDTDLATTLYASAATGTGVTFTAGAGVFLEGDVGRHIIGYDGAEAIITAYTSDTEMVGDILSGSFPLVASPYSSGQWWLDGSPVVECTVNKPGPKGAYVLLQLIAPATDGFRVGDVGKYVQILGGTIKLTVYIDAQHMGGIVVSFLSTWNATINYAYGGAWTMEVETWTSARGYPSCLTLGEQRAIYGGAAAEPDTIRGTDIADYYGFPPGTNDDDALAYVLASEEVNILSWLYYWKGLACGTLGSEFTIMGASGGPLVPSGASGGTVMTPQTTYGSEPMQPDKVEDALLFVERGGRKVREFIYDSRMDSFRAFDLSAFADHLTWTYPFVKSTYQKTPYQLVWYMRSDGSLCTLAYSRENEMTGWARQTTATAAGASVVVSACCIPNPVKKRDDLWLSITRVIGVSTVHTIEILDFDYHLDCAKKWTGAASATVTGLAHLNGQSCQIRGKGADGLWRLYPPQTVASAHVTGLSPTVVEAEVGIAYTATLVTNRLEIQGKGTLQGRIVGIGTITLRCFDTPCLKIGSVRYKGGNQQGMAAGYVPASVYVIPTTTQAIAVPLDDGDIEVSNQGYDRYGRVTVVQDLPIETTITMMTAKVDVGE